MQDAFSTTSEEGPVSKPPAVGPRAANDREPPRLLQVFARLGDLLVIALGFGVIAQRLVAAFA